MAERAIDRYSFIRMRQQMIASAIRDGDGPNEIVYCHVCNSPLSCAYMGCAIERANKAVDAVEAM